MFEASPVLIVLMAFVAVAGLVFVAGNYLSTEFQMQQRIGVQQRKENANLLDGLNSIVVKYFGEKRFKVE